MLTILTRKIVNQRNNRIYSIVLSCYFFITKDGFCLPMYYNVFLKLEIDYILSVLESVKLLFEKENTEKNDSFSNSKYWKNIEKKEGLL